MLGFGYVRLSNFFLGFLCTSISLGAASPEELHRLYKDHQWFKLIAAVRQGGTPLFFRGAVDCALDKTEPCIREMTGVINAGKGGDQEYEAHSILAGFYLRKGEYAQSLAETELILKIRPNDSDAQSNIAFLKAASTFPGQKILSGAAAHVPWTYPTKSLTIPVTINGKRANYFLDTGANVSTLSDADAQRLGLEVHEATVRVNGASGAAATFKVASSKHVSIGNFELENVLFLVFPANQPPFNDKPSLQQGIVGLPILIATKHIRWNRNGFDIVADRMQDSSPTPNLVMDQGYAIANATFQNRSLSFLLDSGSIWTFMYPRFAHDYMNYVKAHGTRTTKQLQGFGGQANVAAWRLAELPIEIGGTTDNLHQIDALLDYTDENSHNYDGCLGLDVMLNRDMVDFNFERMQIVVR
jgi:Aspartyl protease